MHNPNDINEEILAMLERLSRTRSGIGFIYDTLDELQAKYELDEVVATVHHPEVGTQPFRSRHRRTARKLSIPESLLSQPGLLGTPEGRVPSQLSSICIELFRLALDLDIARYDASHDPLTGLANRRSFDTGLRQVTSQSLRYGWPFTLALIDLDGLKSLNDTYGHPFGDQVLCAVASSLRTTLRSSDIVARVGGDEFAAVISNTDPEQLPVLFDRVKRQLESMVDISIGLSIGAASVPMETSDPEQLYELADSRLYQAKQQRKGPRGTAPGR